MKIINMHDAKTQLSKLVREASSGEPFLIAKAGKPIVKVEKFEEPKEIKRLGFYARLKVRFLIILIPLGFK
jgi:prevent-host-death family protein